MKKFDVSCPVCGKLNKHLYLEETSGRMECERCHAVVHTKQSADFHTRTENKPKMSKSVS